MSWALLKQTVEHDDTTCVAAEIIPPMSTPTTADRAAPPALVAPGPCSHRPALSVPWNTNRVLSGEMAPPPRALYRPGGTTEKCAGCAVVSRLVTRDHAASPYAIAPVATAAIAIAPDT